MVRLNSKLLPIVPQLQCHSLFSTHVTIALLNVRSIVAKLPDIARDSNLRCASILCFCETWLTASQPSPLVKDNQIAITCNSRTSGDNKGGVMSCVPPDMQPSNTHTFASNGIEALCTTLLLPNATVLQIGLLYRSPTVSWSNLIAVLIVKPCFNV